MHKGKISGRILRVAVIGAGIAGLAAARRLHQAGHSVAIFEKSRGVGGRVATRRADGYIWDTGATSVAPRGKAIEAVLLRELDTDELVQIAKPVHIHAGLRVSPGSERRTTARYAYRSGMNRLGKLLAGGLDVRTESLVDQIDSTGGTYRVFDEEFDRVIVNAPIPQASTLLWPLGISKPTANVRYRSCLSVGLGFGVPTPELPYFALLDPEQRHPLTWLSIESGKIQGRAPDGKCSMVAQLSSEFSQVHYEADEEWLVTAVCGYLQRLYGPEFQAPEAYTVMRWKYSQPVAFASFGNVNPLGSTVFLAGDALAAGRIEDAFDVGIQTADRLLEGLSVAH